MGLYGIALGEAVQWALQFWPGTSQNDATFTPLFLALFLVVGASLLLLVSLLVLKVHWLLVIAAFLLSLLTPFVQGRLFPADVTLWTTNWFLTYGGGVVVLSFILLGRLKGVRPVLWRTLLLRPRVLPFLLLYWCYVDQPIGNRQLLALFSRS
jgi:hypothetical protein